MALGVKINMEIVRRLPSGELPKNLMDLNIFLQTPVSAEVLNSYKCVSLNSSVGRASDS